MPRGRTREPSNRMPQYESPPVGAAGWGCMTALAILIIAECVAHPIVAVALLALVLIVILVSQLLDARVEPLTERRRGESICQFARSFNCRSIDTWIIRAVYEELTGYTGFAIRATDRLKELYIDEDELDDMACVIAERTRRPLDETESNPMYAKVKTVSDLVAFFTHQPVRLFWRCD